MGSLQVRMGLTLIVVVAICVFAAFYGPAENSDGQALLWYSILPPLLAIALAVGTGHIVPSLAIAVVLGGLLVTVPGEPASLDAWFNGVDTGFEFISAAISDSWNQQLLIFVALVLAMIAIVVHSGGLHGVVQGLSKFAKGPRSAQFVTWIMGLLVFIDDYANTMIVGSAMRPITDRYKISREKLAFLVDATSAPIAGLAVVSTWVGYEVGLFRDQAADWGMGTSAGYDMLFDALPFRFYCILMILFVFVLIVTGRDFGPMRRAESRTRSTGEVAEEDAVPMTSATFSSAEPDPSAKPMARNAIIPIGFLFFGLLAGIWFDGGGGDKLRENMLALFDIETWRDVISDSENSVKILAYCAGISVPIAAICARVWAGVDNHVIRSAVASGVRSSLLPIAILSLAWSIKGACDALDTAPFLVAWVGDTVSPAFFAAAIFCVAIVTSFATGTSYGTMGILIPIAAPIAFHLDGDVYGATTILTLACILDGSIVGDHCSPISDTTIMSSIASSCDHIHHVRTQLPYSVSIGAIALLCGYIPVGLGLSGFLSFAIGIAAIIGLVFLVGRPSETVQT